MCTVFQKRFKPSSGHLTRLSWDSDSIFIYGKRCTMCFLNLTGGGICNSHRLRKIIGDLAFKGPKARKMSDIALASTCRGVDWPPARL